MEGNFARRVQTAGIILQTVAMEWLERNSFQHPGRERVNKKPKLGQEVVAQDRLGNGGKKEL
jgi:hypothetical protein